MINDQNTEKNKSSKEDLTNDLTGQEPDAKDSEKGKRIGVGYEKDAGLRSVDSDTAGGREGKFSQQENQDEEGLDTDWSPGANQPRS